MGRGDLSRLRMMAMIKTSWKRFFGSRRGSWGWFGSSQNVLYCYALRLIGWNNVSFTDTFSGDFQEIGGLKCDGVFWDDQGYGFLRWISQRVRSARKADALCLADY